MCCPRLEAAVDDRIPARTATVVIRMSAIPLLHSVAQNLSIQHRLMLCTKRMDSTSWPGRCARVDMHVFPTLCAAV